MLTLKKGEDFFVGEQRFLLTDISPNELVFSVDGEPLKVGKQWAEAGAHILLSVAKIGRVNLSYARLAIEAPNYKVLRGKYYREIN